jgi:hypothetical protein
MGRLTGGDGERRRGCRAAAVVLLGHPGQAERQEVVRFTGNGWCTGSMATPESSMERASRERRMSGR